MDKEIITNGTNEASGTTAEAGNSTEAGGADAALTAEQLAYQISERRRKANEAEAGGGERAEARTTNEEADGQQQQENTETPDADQGGSEAPAEEAAGAETEDTEGSEEPGELPAELQEKIDRRIGKEVAKRKRLEEELARVKAELEGKGADEADGEERAEARTTNRNQPESGSAYEEGLVRELAQLRTALEWAEENPDGGAMKTGDGKEFTFTREQTRAIKLNTLEDIGVARQKLESYRAQTRESNAKLLTVAKQEYPWLNKPSAIPPTDAAEKAKYDAGVAKYGLAQRMLREFPALKGIPGGLLAIGDIVEATMKRIEKNQAKANGNGTNGKNGKRPAPRIPTRIPAGGGAAGPGAGGGKKIEVDFASANSVEGLAASFAKQRVMRDA